jgi:uncharacterized protein YyaL (SSP411 family)
MAEAVFIDGFQPMKRMFDASDRGIGSAPKFPPTEMIECGSWQRRRAKLRATHGLFHAGAIVQWRAFGQFGGGCARHAVHDECGILHFEVMLYNNGPLLRLLADARYDYVFLIKASLAMLQANFRSEDLALAQRLAGIVLNQFEDRENDGFFFTSYDHERLI